MFRPTLSPSKSILIAGATGLVGRACARRFLSDPAFERMVTLTRRPLPEEIRRLDGSDKIEEHVIDFDALSDERHGHLFQVDQILCCLGTTIKQAGSEEQFRQVDYGYPKALAEIGHRREVGHYLLVSALGANPRSRIFYNRVKGDVEEAVLSVPFRAVTILRPSFLMGDRRKARLGEEVARRLQFLFPPKYRPVSAEDVAAVLLNVARRDESGRRVIESVEIRARARSLRSQPSTGNEAD